MTEINRKSCTVLEELRSASLSVHRIYMNYSPDG